VEAAQTLKSMLGMRGGCVLNFSDRSFGDFFDEHRVEIDAKGCRARGTFKAKPHAHPLNWTRSMWSAASSVA